MMSDRDSILDKFKGTLLGCAVGDALGAPVEGMPPEAIRQKHGTVTDFIDERFGAGMVTDDTQMTITLAQAILEMGSFIKGHAALKFGRWMQNSDEGVKEARGVGMATAEACRKLYQGVSPEESGVDSAGCGAAMRVSPLGLRYFHDLETLRRTAVEQSRITHTDPEAAAGAVAIAFAVARGITEENELDRLSFIQQTADFVSPVNEGMADRIRGLRDYMEVSPSDGFAYTGNGGYIMETVPGALLSFLLSPYDFERTVVTAVNAGGDTDSLGAMAGVVSGAFNGASRIPERWRERVEGKEYIELLAVRLCSLTPAGKPAGRPFI
jgi:ADP-ribosyl-[dinitrogen reductase] hydrolase